MKRVCWLLILVILLGCFAGCHQQPVEGSALSNSQKSEIKNAWKNAHEGDFPGWYDRNGPYTHGLVYLGTDNGYHMLLLSPMNVLDAVSNINIAGKNFKMPHSFSMYAFKNGEFTNLSSAYRKGYVSDEGIANAFERYKEYVCSAYPKIADILGYK